MLSRRPALPGSLPDPVEGIAREMAARIADESFARLPHQASQADGSLGKSCGDQDRAHEGTGSRQTGAIPYRQMTHGSPLPPAVAATRRPRCRIREMRLGEDGGATTRPAPVTTQGSMPPPARTPRKVVSSLNGEEDAIEPRSHLSPSPVEKRTSTSGDT